MGGYSSGAGGDVVLYDAFGVPITGGPPADSIPNDGVRGLDTRAFNHLFDGTVWHRQRSAYATFDGNNGSVSSGSAGFSWNGSTWDKNRNNVPLLIAGRADRSMTATSGIFKSYNARGISVLLEVFSDPGAGETLQLGIFSTSPGQFNPLRVIAAAPIVAGVTGITFIQWGAGAVADYDNPFATYAKSQSLVSPEFFVGIVHSASGVWNYQVSGNLLV